MFSLFHASFFLSSGCVAREDYYLHPFWGKGAAHCSINMYFVLNVNACIVHFSHENESLRGIQLGPGQAGAHCQGAALCTLASPLSASPGAPGSWLWSWWPGGRALASQGQLWCLPSVWAGSAPRGHTGGNQPNVLTWEGGVTRELWQVWQVWWDSDLVTCVTWELGPGLPVPSTGEPGDDCPMSGSGHWPVSALALDIWDLSVVTRDWPPHNCEHPTLGQIWCPNSLWLTAALFPSHLSWGHIFEFFSCPWVCDGVYVARWGEERAESAPGRVQSWLGCWPGRPDRGHQAGGENTALDTGQTGTGPHWGNTARE